MVYYHTAVTRERMTSAMQVNACQHVNSRSAKKASTPNNHDELRGVSTKAEFKIKMQHAR